MKNRQRWQQIGAAAAALLAVGIVSWWMVSRQDSGPEQSRSTETAAGKLGPANERLADPSGERPADQAISPSLGAGASSTRSTHPRSASPGGAVTFQDVDRRENVEPGEAETLGEMAIARVTVDQKSRELRPNQVGVFERIPAQAGTPMAVEIAYPGGLPDQEVAVAVEDGGSIDNKAAMKLLRLDAQQRIRFRFIPGNSDGVYRVTLRKGTDQKTFEVWVGAPLKLAGE